MIIELIITHLSHQVILRDIERMEEDDGDDVDQDDGDDVDQDDGEYRDEGGEYEKVWVWTIERARLLNYRALRVILACV